MLKDDVNYIVSGLERSGTSLMMQILHMGGVPVAFDDSRSADEHNPRGYFELAGGKIINRLMDGTFDLESRKGCVIKVTAYGLKFLPAGSYRIIYMMRQIDEVLSSMRKMGAPIDWEKDKTLFNKLNKFSLDLIEGRGDVEYMTVNYSDIIARPSNEIEKVRRFLDAPLDIEKAAGAVDPSLYRNKAGK